MGTPDTFIDGLRLYLQLRDWALEKMKAVPVGSQPLDIEVYQYMYLANALGACDLVGETFYGSDFRKPAYETPYDKAVIQAFDQVVVSTSQVRGKEAYGYVRELRNSVVHRGLGSAMAAHANDQFVFALCPPKVTNVNGKGTFRAPWKYMPELAAASTVAINTVIAAELGGRGTLEAYEATIAPLSDVLKFIDDSEAMPDLVKGMARQAFSSGNYDDWARQAMGGIVKELKTRLGIPIASPLSSSEPR